MSCLVCGRECYGHKCVHCENLRLKKEIARLRAVIRGQVEVIKEYQERDDGWEALLCVP